jgi:hypothetical protein
MSFALSYHDCMDSGDGLNLQCEREPLGGEIGAGPGIWTCGRDNAH